MFYEVVYPGPRYRESFRKVTWERAQRSADAASRSRARACARKS